MEHRQDEHLTGHDATFAIDPDLALLEAYLDGALPPNEVTALEQRLRADPELAAALGRLNAEFDVRQAVWTSLDGTPAEASRVAAGLSQAVRASRPVPTWWQRSRRAVGWVSAAAACLVCFAAGWVGRGTTATAALPAKTTPAAVEQPLVYQVALTDEQGNITAIQKFDSLEDAQAFAADLGRWQARQAQLQNGQAVLMTTGL